MPKADNGRHKHHPKWQLWKLDECGKGGAQDEDEAGGNAPSAKNGRLEESAAKITHLSGVRIPDKAHKAGAERGEKILLTKYIGKANKADNYCHDDPIRHSLALFQEGRRQEQKHCHCNGSKGHAPQKAHCRGYDCK